VYWPTLFLNFDLPKGGTSAPLAPIWLRPSLPVCIL